MVFFGESRQGGDLVEQLGTSCDRGRDERAKGVNI